MSFGGRRIQRCLRAVVAAAAVCALAVAPASAATATKTKTGWKTDPETWGVNDRLLHLNLGDAELAPRIAAMQRLGARWVRSPVNWPRIQEAGPGTYRWAEADNMVRRLAIAGLRWRPMTLDVPNWMKPYPQSSVRQPPADPSRVAEFLEALVGRYGSQGTFWSANGGIPRLPVLDVELHNEPNATYFWGVDPTTWTYRTDVTGAAWGRLYGTALDRVPSATRRARFWMGGLVAPAPVSGVPAASFVHEAFRAHPRLRSTLAGVAVHTYPFGGVGVRADPTQATDAVGAVVAAIRTYSRALRIQINEFGASKLRVTDEANRIAILEHVADLVRSRCPIQGIAPFENVSWEADPNGAEHWYGLASPATGALYAEGAAWAAKVTDYNAGRQQGRETVGCR